VAQPRHSDPSYQNTSAQPLPTPTPSTAFNYPFPDFALPPREDSFTGILDGSADFALMNDSPWDSPFNLFLPPSNLGVPSVNPILLNPHHSHLGLFNTAMDGADGFAMADGTNGAGGPSGSNSQTDSNSHSASAEHTQRTPYM
jgi:hypothetical protein